jgi:hypothetical protein
MKGEKTFQMGHKASLDLHNDMVGFVETKHGL